MFRLSFAGSDEVPILFVGVLHWDAPPQCAGHCEGVRGLGREDPGAVDDAVQAQQGDGEMVVGNFVVVRLVGQEGERLYAYQQAGHGGAEVSSHRVDVDQRTQELGPEDALVESDPPRQIGQKVNVKLDACSQGSAELLGIGESKRHAVRAVCGWALWHPERFGLRFSQHLRQVFEGQGHLARLSRSAVGNHLREIVYCHGRTALATCGLRCRSAAVRLAEHGVELLCRQHQPAVSPSRLGGFPVCSSTRSSDCIPVPP